MAMPAASNGMYIRLAPSVRVIFLLLLVFMVFMVLVFMVLVFMVVVVVVMIAVPDDF